MKKAILLLLAAALFGPAPAALAAPDLVVTHYEELAALAIGESLADGRQKVRSGSPVTLSFDALGRRYELELAPNDRLLSPAVRGGLAPGVAVYRGTVAGLPKSWARIVIADGVPRGAIWDGSELLAIEAPGDSAIASPFPVIYRMQDSYVVPGSMSCGTEPASGNAAAAYEKLVGELEVAMAQGPGASEELDIGLVSDFEQFQRFGSDEADAEAAMLSRFNVVDGIYSEQLGVQLSVRELQVFTDAGDPFTDETEGEPLLNELSAWRRDTPAQNAQGLTHLYTGRDLDGSTVGIAWQDALCGAFVGAGLSEGRRNMITDALIAAHEVGHNFGAEHDGEDGSVCESTAQTFLMAPSVNGNDQFSQCSIDTITPRIAAASCITPLPTVDMRMSLDDNPSPVLLGTDASLTFTAANSGTQSATGVEIDIALPDNFAFVSADTEFGTCTSGAGEVNCTYGTVPGNGSRSVTLTATATEVGDGTFTATVSADTDVNAGNDEQTATLTVDPAVDLAVNALAAAQAEVDDVLSVRLDLENRTVPDASGVEVSISLASGLRADEASWPLGDCTVADQQVDCTADLFAGQSTATVELGLTATANGGSSFTVSVSSAEADTDTGNNSITASVQVGAASMPDGGGSTSGGGGGGGAENPLWLLLLGASAGCLSGRRRPGSRPGSAYGAFSRLGTSGSSGKTRACIVARTMSSSSLRL